MTEPGRLLWEPPRELREDSAMCAFMRERGFDDYDALWKWSVEEPEEFWGALWELFEIQASKPYDEVLGKREMPGAEWFPGAELNYAEHVFRMARPGEAALVHASESAELDETSWDELRDQVARCAAGLRRLGVEKGDRVVAYMPNIPETVVAFLATASIGAIWSSCAPEFGTPTVVDRFKQIEPKVLLAIEGYRYGGKDFDKRDAIAKLEEEIPSLEHTVLVPSGWDELLGEQEGAELEFEQVPFDHPLWVLYSSGTTGLPKAIVQGQGGILIEHLKKSRLHSDLSAGDRFFWFTTTGWMMWNFLVGGLLIRRGDRALRRAAGPRGDVGLRRGRRSHVLRHQRGLPRRLHEGGRRAGARQRPEPAEEPRLDRLAAAGGGLRVGLRAREGGHLAVLHERRNGPLHGLRGRLPAQARLRGRAAGAGAGRAGGGLERGRQSG